jgi:AraC-like DNA-binding protein
MRFYPPGDILSPYIRTFLVHDHREDLLSTLLPDTGIVIAFRYKGSGTITRQDITIPIFHSVVSGLQDRFRQVRHFSNSGLVLAIFREGGAYPFFKESLHTLFGESLPLDSFVPPSIISRVEDQLSASVSDIEKIRIVETFLLSQMKNSPMDILVAELITSIRQAKGIVRINELAAAYPISRDPLEKRFRQVVGTSPKQFAAIVRFRNIIRQYSPDRTLTDLAYDAGYFDQSHFNRDFKLFTGQSPRLFFQSPPHW